MYYPSSENKGADQLRGSAPLFSPMQIVGFPMGRLNYNRLIHVECTYMYMCMPDRSPLSTFMSEEKLGVTSVFKKKNLV